MDDEVLRRLSAEDKNNNFDPERFFSEMTKIAGELIAAGVVMRPPRP